MIKIKIPNDKISDISPLATNHIVTKFTVTISTIVNNTMINNQT